MTPEEKNHLNMYEGAHDLSDGGRREGRSKANGVKRRFQGRGVFMSD